MLAGFGYGHKIFLALENQYQDLVSCQNTHAKIWFLVAKNNTMDE